MNLFHERIEDADAMASLDKGVNQVRTDKTGTARDQDIHFFHLKFFVTPLPLSGKPLRPLEQWFSQNNTFRRSRVPHAPYRDAF